MLAVLFSVGTQRCGLDSAVVERIVPALPLDAVPGGPPSLAGTFSYHGTRVPVVDLVQRDSGRPASTLLSSRIILARHMDGNGSPRLVGLLAERVNEVLPFSSQSSSSVAGTFHVVTTAQLVPADLFEQFSPEVAAP